MVKVKIIAKHEQDLSNRLEVGKIYEAFEIKNSYDHIYAVNLGDCIYWLPIENAEVVEDTTGIAATEEKPTQNNKRVLLVEDGSVDIDKLEEDGFYVIVYRQGGNKPEWLE